MKIGRLSISLLLSFFLFESCDNQETNNNNEPEVGVDAPGAQMEDYALYTTWDGDNSGFIEEQEYNNTIGKTSFFANLDENGDNQLSEQEFRNGLEESQVNYDEWDINNNGNLDESEFKKATWELFNENNDEGIDQEEFDTYLEENV